MELSDLRTLMIVSEERSFSRAALLLHRTQPAISLAVRRLEQRVGTALFSRETKRPELTDAGRLLVGYAQAMRTLEDEARTALAELRGLRRGDVTIGVDETLVPVLFPLVGAFRENHPGIRVEVATMTATEVRARLARGELDFGVADVRPGDEGLFETAAIGAERWVVVLPSEHPLASRAALSLADVGQETLIAVAECAQGHGTIAELFKRHKVPFRPGLALPSLEATRLAVEQGLGLTILPSAAVARDVAGGRLRSVPIDEAPGARPIWLVRSSARTPSVAAAALFQLARRRAGQAGLPRAEAQPASPTRVA